MKYFLVIVLMLDVNIEEHIAVEMPNKATCESLKHTYVHAAELTLGDTPEQDRRVQLKVDEVVCLEVADE